MAGELERLLIRLEADTSQLRRELERGDSAVKKFSDNTEKHAARAEQAFKRFLGAAAVTASVREFAKLADQYTLMENRLKAITKSSGEFSHVQTEVYKAAQETRLSLVEVNELYARLAFSLKDVGVSTNDLLQLTETLSKATVVSGASQAEAAGALRQLSQGMAAGTLRGQELNSVMEQLPIVADMIAKAMGVTVGELRKLGEQGKITGKEVFDAIIAGSAEIDAQFAKTSPTIAQSFTQMNNALTVFAGLVDDNIGFTDALAAAFGRMAGKIAEANKELKTTGTLSIWEQIKNTPQWMVDRLTMQPIKPQQAPVPKLKGGVFSDEAPGVPFDPNAKGVDKTPGAIDPWAASIIPPTYEEQLREFEQAWRDVNTAAMDTLTDIIDSDTAPIEDKINALTAAVKSGEIGWRDYLDGMKAVNQQSTALMDDLLSTTSQTLGAIFKESKTAAIAQALINTYQGITKALTLPPPYSFAMAALTAAQGFAAVNSIRSQSQSGGGGGGASVAAAGGAAAAPAAAQNAPAQDSTMTVKGLSAGQLFDGTTVRGLAEKLIEFQRNGGKILLAS